MASPHTERVFDFFSSRENLRIGDIPFVCSGTKPSRDEALSYYRWVPR